MNNKDYLLPSLAAVALAVLFPLYWINQISFGSTDMSAALFDNINKLSFSDGIFIAIGILSIYVYFSLKKILNDRLNFKGIDILLALVIGVQVIFLSTIGLDITAAVITEQQVVNSENTLVGIGLAVAIGSVIAFGLLDIIIGAVLLKNKDKLPTLVKIFALATLIQGVLGITIVFSFATLVTFPVSLIVLAVYFMREPETVEVV